ncbi:MAG: YIP1 family protein [candidate division Zixibacteria bacterium]|nr:YIP1 family protein [candidate division Zixibacteria bacterium]
MEMENSVVSPTPESAVQRLGLISRFWRVFIEPTKLFPTLNRKTDWLIPFVIVAVLGGIMGFMTRPIYTRELMPMAMQNIEKYRQQMGEEQFNRVKAEVQKGFDEAAANPFKWYYFLIWFLYPLVIFGVISALGLIAGNFLFGGKANFWIIVNVVAYAALVGLLGDIVRTALVLSKDSISVYTGLGLLRPVDDGSFLFYLIRQIDAFTIWRIIVTAIGLGVVYNMKPKKFGYVLLSVWLIFILIVSLGNLFTGGTIIY